MKFALVLISLAIGMLMLFSGCGEYDDTQSQVPVAASSSETPTLLAFSSALCGPCKAQRPMIDLVEDTKKITVVHVDIDKQFGLAQQYHIESLPTYVLLVNGVEVWRGGDANQIYQYVRGLP